MLRTCGFKNLDEMTDAAVPKHIRLHAPVELEPAKSESEALAELKAIAGKNKVLKSLIGMGYYETGEEEGGREGGRKEREEKRSRRKDFSS
eukprot:evm.model.NODE_25271_length_4905_cov_21.888481.1